MANEGSRVRVLLLPVIVILATMAFSIAPMSVASTPTIDSSGSVNGCGSSNNSGCTYWWDYSLWGNLYPGQTVYFDFAVYNTAPCGCSVQINSLTIQTPWATYTDPSLPQVIDTGYQYFNEFAISIPVNQSTGSVVGSIQFTGQFQDASPWCSSTGDVCSDSANFTITADPSSLQQQVSSLQDQTTSLNSQVGILNGQVTALTNRIANLTAQLTQANGNLSASKQTVATDETSLDQAQASLTTAESNLASVQSQLAAANAQLISKEAALTSTQSGLNEANGVYIPLAAAIPAALAVVFAILYIRKKSVANPSSSG